MAKPTKKPTIPPKPIVLTSGIILVSMPLIFLFPLFFGCCLYVFITNGKIPFHCSRIYLLLELPPRFLSILGIIDLGKVIPSFIVIAKGFSIADSIELF